MLKKTKTNQKQKTKKTVPDMLLGPGRKGMPDPWVTRGQGVSLTHHDLCPVICTLAGGMMAP